MNGTNSGISIKGWARLAQAAQFLNGLGWEYVDAPWAVNAEATNPTVPQGCRAVEVLWPRERGLHLVGSAEQSFIAMVQNDTLPGNKLCALTPCFRDEAMDTLSSLRRRVFMKVEMFEIIPNREDLVGQDLNMASSQDTYPVLDGLGNSYHVSQAIRQTIDDAMRTMSAVAGYNLPMKVVQTGDGWDLEIMGIEVGSYGIRRIEDVRYIYGTGLAEPRFGQVLSMLEGRDEE